MLVPDTDVGDMPQKSNNVTYQLLISYFMNKYAVKLLLWTYDTEDVHPIYLKVTLNSQRRYIATGYSLREKFWDPYSQSVKQAYHEAEKINTDIQDRKQKIISWIIKKNVEGVQLTADQVKDAFSSGDLTNFFEFSERFIKEVGGKRGVATLENYRKVLKKIEGYHGSRLLSFQQITHDWLAGFEAHLRKNLTSNYIHAIWKVIKTFFNAARKRNLITNYPFTSYENPVYRSPRKDYLTLKELRAWEKYVDKAHGVQREAGVYFLLGCYTGLRISDWFLFDKKNIKEGRVLIETVKNKKPVSMIINSGLRRNLKRMTGLTITEPAINRVLKDIAKGAGIDKRVSSHCARRTFAVTVCATRGISLETCARLMGITVKICADNYYSVTQEKIDRETKVSWEGL